MLIFNKKKKNLDNIYNKIVEESKVSYYLFNAERSDTDYFREVFQLNLILILWYSISTFHKNDFSLPDN